MAIHLIPILVEPDSWLCERDNVDLIDIPALLRDAEEIWLAANGYSEQTKYNSHIKISEAVDRDGVVYEHVKFLVSGSHRRGERRFLAGSVYVIDFTAYMELLEAHAQAANATVLGLKAIG